MVCDTFMNTLTVEQFKVLILILLEYGLRPQNREAFLHIWLRLNPYSIGIWSATPKIANH